MKNIIAVIVFLVLVGGYLANIFKLVTYVAPFGIEEALRVIGILAPPLGFIMGFIG